MKSNLVRPESVVISGFRYNNNELTIIFKNGTVYTYFNIPKKVAKEFSKAESKGEYFVHNIKYKYLTVKSGKVCMI